MWFGFCVFSGGSHDVSRLGTSNVQAMSELYDRRTEIYVYSPDGGYRLLRTLHEGTGDAKLPTIRLSYYGGGHYDSIVAADTEAHFVK